MGIRVRTFQSVERLVNDLIDKQENLKLVEINQQAPKQIDQSKLSSEDYQALIEAKFELPVFNQFANHFEVGTYHCKLCDQIIALSEDKYEANSGRPTFQKLVTKDIASYQLDNRLAIPEVAVYCSKCNSFLGYVYDDGQTSTNLRYSLNSQSLVFKEHKDE